VGGANVERSLKTALVCVANVDVVVILVNTTVSFARKCIFWEGNSIRDIKGYIYTFNNYEVIPINRTIPLPSTASDLFLISDACRMFVGYIDMLVPSTVADNACRKVWTFLPPTHAETRKFAFEQSVKCRARRALHSDKDTLSTRLLGTYADLSLGYRTKFRLCVLGNATSRHSQFG
jgi:hypothetical protein